MEDRLDIRVNSLRLEIIKFSEDTVKINLYSFENLKSQLFFILYSSNYKICNKREQ